MTPNDINILLHFYTTPEPLPRADAPAVKEAVLSFVQREILVWEVESANEGTGRYRVTQKGEKLVRMLCDTPDPVQEWLDPRGMATQTLHEEMRWIARAKEAEHEVLKQRVEILAQQDCRARPKCGNIHNSGTGIGTKCALPFGHSGPHESEDKREGWG
jgi:hypothetical protein